jgi:hypothetical protein
MESIIRAAIWRSDRRSIGHPLSGSRPLDDNKYETGRRISDEEFASLNIERDDFHLDWNYAIFPSKESL